jgi:hypothetical protein
MNMKGLKRTIAGFVGAAVVGLAEPAHAIPLPIGTTIVNFDFSGEVPPPPYNTVLTQFVFTVTGGVLFSSFSIYNDLNGGDVIFSTNLGFSSGNPSSSLSFPLSVSETGGPSDFMLDGQFSFGFVLASGLVDLTFTDTANGSSATPVTINGEVAATDISEPSMDFLFALGLAALLVSRQRSGLRNASTV